MSQARGAQEKPLGMPGRIGLVAFLIPVTYLAAGDPINFVAYLPYAATGAFLAIRRPRNAVSWMVLLIAFGFAPTTARPEMDIAALEAGTASTADALLAWGSSWGGVIPLGFLALTLLFPTGRLPEGRWRWLAITLLAAAIALIVLSVTAPTVSIVWQGGTTITVPNRFAVLPDLPIWRVIPPEALILPANGLLLIGTGWMLVRYRRATGVLRLQLRWLLAAIAFVALAVSAAIGLLAAFGNDFVIAWIPALVAYLTVPIAIGVAIMRYRLYDIDVILRRTLVYALVTGVLGAVYVITVLMLQTLLSPLTSGSGLAIAATTLGVAALFRPVRDRIQRAVDRRFNRSRYDASRTLELFATRLRHEIELDTLTAELRNVVGATMEPSSISIWVRRQ